ncbi:uncharacterized protein PGRI_083330 [Penicillium griseofulvum]|uniref:Apple domain-containing protein n=1 Tax=Penicillium patulum TaxID=5078 RepID=A0A135LSZ1_PENPA|nr:uncharacterized protein PGRI_083330 [Penicillium griseofulvum]KXG52049.1 hypothetical protein PGRI_083330 [Penicillium griseofulvum]
MKIAPFWVSIALEALAVLAEPIKISATSTTSTAAKPTCTASLITKLCSYKEPEEGTAVAASGTDTCWDYCNAHPPCDFSIFVRGNPYTGTGTCWLYPGETFDESEGSSDCADPYLSVYDKPVCSGGPTPTTGGCTATETPSAIASVCGYPPPDDCEKTCTASDNAQSCLKQCANADSCSYVVFNANNPNHSPYLSGNCWMFSSGTFDKGSTTTCDGKPEQYVYENVCPKPLL